MQGFFTDIHCHPTLRALNVANSYSEADYWEVIENQTIKNALAKWAVKQTSDIAKASQTNLKAAVRGNVRVLFDSLYPLEQGFLNIRKLPAKLLGTKGASTLIRTITGISVKRLSHSKINDNYFAKLQEHYTCLVKNQGSSPCGTYQYRITNNYETLRNNLIDGQTLSIVPTIEGGHVLGCGTEDSEKIPLKVHKQIISRNIKAIKSWEYPPFFINLAHHFWNQLCGHAPSIKPPGKHIMNQKKGLFLGITELGWHAIYELLSPQNGKKILIDVKHMSARARKEYYQFIAINNYINPDNKIPIICSHTGLNGVNTLNECINRQKKLHTKAEHYFHDWEINLCAEDVRAIHQSGGLLGIMMDKGMLAHKSYLKKIDGLEESAQKDAFVKLIWDNIFEAIRSVNKKTAWDIIAFGSDFDGIITHIDSYPNYAYLPQLQHDMLTYLEQYRYKQDLWFGYEPAELVHKILTENTMHFLRKYYV